MIGPITQAKNTPLCASVGLPDVSQVVNSFLQPMLIGIVQTTMINGYANEIIVYKKVKASRQPMAEQLAIRKEGDRSWRWHVIHATSELDLATNDVVVLKNIRYRVMQRIDWAEYGFREYHAIETYKPEGTL